MNDEQTISFEDFKKLNIKIGKIVSAEKIPETDKLLLLSVDCGEESPRQIVSGISEYFPNESDLIGRKCPFILNLEPRKIRGHESNGMILAVATDDGKFSLLEPNEEIIEGSSVR